MKEVHKGMGITNAEFDAAVADLKKALEKNDVKGDDAAAVLKAVEATRKDIVEPKPPEKEEKDKPAAELWDQLGGEKVVAKVMDDFVDLAAKNPKADFTRGGKHKPDDKQVVELKKRLVEMVSEATGGPLKYTGKDMKEAHKGMNITDAEFDALADDLKKALEKNGVKADVAGELLKIVEGTRKHIVEKKGEEGQVRGTIRFAGRPLGDVTITFVPINEPAAKGPSAVSGEDGTYEVKGGLKPGEYHVVVTAPGEKVKVPAKYVKAETSGIKAEVKKGANELAIELAP
jgi:truncated hemoglobin YjbI